LNILSESRKKRERKSISILLFFFNPLGQILASISCPAGVPDGSRGERGIFLKASLDVFAASKAESK
jgi:hypothetical protein